MGQKSNSNSLRIGINNNSWSSKYLGKNSEESTLFVFQDLEIRNYINRFFYLHGLLIDKCSIQRSDSSLKIFVSYFNLLEVISVIDRITIQLNDYLKSEKINNYSYGDISILQNRKNLKKSYHRSLFNKKKLFLSKTFSQKLVGCLNLYLKKNFKIQLILQNINKSLSVRLNNREVVEFRKIITQLRSYSKSYFFKETINVIIVLIKNQSSSKLFSDYIALKLGSMKRHNFFLTFLKRSLTLFISSNFSSIKGIKLKIKGRFNGVPRAKPRLIQIGETPLQMYNSKVSYHCSTSFTSNGTFGVQLWVS